MTIAEVAWRGVAAAARAVFYLFLIVFAIMLFDTRKNGTGYGGRSGDCRELAEGRKRATQDEAEQDAITVSYLIHVAPQIRDTTLKTCDVKPLVAVLERVFHQAVPVEWSKKKKVLVLSLTCLSLLVEKYDLELILGNDSGSNQADGGDEGSSDSIGVAFQAMADYARFIRMHDKTGSEHALLVEKILSIQNVMSSNIEAGRPSWRGQRSDPNLYRATLGPLRFSACEAMANHSFAAHRQSNKPSMRALFQELSSYKNALPVEWGSSIFVRALESRVDVLRALIIGPEGRLPRLL